MFARALDDQYLHAANLLVCAGTLATPVGVLAAGGAVVAGTLSFKEVVKRMRPEQADMATQIAKLLKEKTAEQSHLKGDTAITLPDMVAAGMPSAQTIIDTKQQTKPLIDAMVAHLATLGQPDYTLAQNVTAFRAVLHPVFEKLLTDVAFTAHLGPLRERILLEIPDMLREVRSDVADVKSDTTAILAALEQLKSGQSGDAIPIADLQTLAKRFGLPQDADKSSLLPLLRDKATEYTALKAEVDAIPETMRNLANLKAAAQDAIDRVDLEEVENLMSKVHETELEEAAKSAEIRATNSLLRGKAKDAFRYFSAAADSFAAVDQAEPARRRLVYHEVFYLQNFRYGGNGMAHAEAMIRDAIELLDRESQADLWAHAQERLAGVLQNQGTFTDGPEGVQLLAQAVAAYRAALDVFKHSEKTYYWSLYTEFLGKALREQGLRTQGAEGVELLAQAATAFRSALEIVTRADHPVQWATTQNNLGNVLGDQGTRTKGAKGKDLLAQAVSAYRSALEVRTRADHPVDWAMTQENIAICEQERAAHDSCPDPRPPLTAALEAVQNALTVYNPEHMSYDYGTATKLRDRIQTKLNTLPPA